MDQNKATQITIIGYMVTDAFKPLVKQGYKKFYLKSQGNKESDSSTKKRSEYKIDHIFYSNA
jgi:hypothetical protein